MRVCVCARIAAALCGALVVASAAACSGPTLSPPVDGGRSSADGGLLALGSADGEAAFADAGPLGAKVAWKSATAGSTEKSVFVFNVVTTHHQAVAVTDFDDKCGSGKITGHVLYLDLFQNPSQPDSSITTTGSFANWPLPPNLMTAQSMPSDNVFRATYSASDSKGTMGSVARGGSITITRLSKVAIGGEFELEFPDGRASGRFSAPICGTWLRSGNVL